MEESSQEVPRPASSVTITQIEEKLRQLSPTLLGVVYDVVTELVEKQPLTIAEAAMLASQEALGQLWNTPAEDEMWAHLNEQVTMAEEGMSDYLPQLEAYEDRLARGEITYPPPDTPETNS